MEANGKGAPAAVPSMLYWRYQLDCIEWMGTEGFTLDDLMFDLADLLDSYSPDARGNDDHAPSIALMDVWKEFLYDPETGGFRSHGAKGRLWQGEKEWCEDRWAELGDVPVDDDGRTDMDWLGYPARTDREDIWHDFDAMYAEWGGVRALMFEGERLPERYVEWSYVPDNAEAESRPYRWRDLFELTGDVEAARHLADNLEWQHPETLLDEDVQLGILVEEGARIRVNDSDDGYDETGFVCPRCGNAESFVASDVVLTGETHIDRHGWDYSCYDNDADLADDAELTCCRCGYRGGHAEFERPARGIGVSFDRRPTVSLNPYRYFVANGERFLLCRTFVEAKQLAVEIRCQKHHISELPALYSPAMPIVDAGDGRTLVPTGMGTVVFRGFE